MAKSQTISVTAVPGQRISVGINYPWAWNKYGVYFGSGESVPGDHPEYDVWLSNLDRNLGQIEDIVSVVRIFLLCNFNNLGATKDGQGPTVVQSQPVNPWDPPPKLVRVTPWRNFVPPATVSPIYTDQLDKMLKIFNKHQMKVMPCLTDFPAFAQGPDSGGKTDIITDPTMKAWFFNNIVDPFLDVSVAGDNGKAVFAWDIMNEPGQVTDSLHSAFLHKTTFPIPRMEMQSFLLGVAARISAKGLKSTVGHHYAGDLDGIVDFPMGNGDFRQFHYYPQNTSGITGFFVPSKLPPQSETQAFVGEFQSAYTQGDQATSVPWPEIPIASQQGDGFSRTVSRLQLLEAKGYGLALLWPDLGGPGIDYQSAATAASEPLHFSQRVLDGIRFYVKGSP